MKKSKAQQQSSTLWLCRFIKPYTFLLLTILVGLSLAAGTILFLGHGLRILIDQGFASDSPEFLNQTLLYLLGLVSLLAVASFTRSFFSAKLGEYVAADIKRVSFRHLLTLPPSFYQDHSVGSLQSRLYSDTTLIQVLLGSSASTGLRSIIQGIGATLLLFYSNLMMASLACLIIPLVVVPLAIFGRSIKKEARISQAAEGKTASFSNECLSAIQTIQAYNQETRIDEQFTRFSQKSLQCTKRRIFAQSCLSTVVIFLVFAAVSLLLWYGGQEVFANKITSGELISFIFYAVVAAGSINSLSLVYGDWQRAMGACTRIQEILTPESFPTHQGSNASLEEECPGKIQFENVDFSYPDAKEIPVLKSLNLSIKRGETIALVGPSGAGKSTVFKLLLKFFHPHSGRILLEDVDLKDISNEDVRKIIGWVPQNPSIFSDTVANNIRFSKPHATDDEVRRAAQAAYAADFINKLPAGFETRLESQGHQLSSGQKQRIAIARAILKNPAILLLDEATNALDSVSEFQVQKALDNLMKDRTTILVAHRLSTALKANRLVVMDHGEIISTGSHTSLMRNCSVYRRFVSLQFEQPEQKLAVNKT